jgi:uncharacterized peroxidase-related enzyme
VAHDYRRADLDPRVRALCDFAVRLTREPASVSQEEIARLHEHGWSDAGIHDAIQVVAFFNYINRVADAVGIGPEPEWSGGDGAPR